MSHVYESRKRKVYEYKFPQDRFDLVEELDTRIYKHHMKSGRVKPIKQHMVKLRCKKCGDVKTVCDKKDVGCKQGPCAQRFVDRTDKVFGSLTALEFVKTDNKTQPWQWRCLCSCGKSEIISTLSLVNGRTSCEECSRKRASVLTTKKGKGSSWSRVIRQYKRGALKNGVCFTLDDCDMRHLFRSNCVYCGAEPKKDTYGLTRNGIDRRVNEEGYTIENVVACCSTCNIMKAAHTPASFHDHITRIYTHMKTKFNDYPEREYTQAGGNGEDPKLSQFGRVMI